MNFYAPRYDEVITTVEDCHPNVVKDELFQTARFSSDALTGLCMTART